LKGGSIVVRIPTHKPPTHPGEMLLLEFMRPMRLSQHRLADEIKLPYRRIHDLVHGRDGVTPGLALRLGIFFGNTPDFWLNLQLRWDLWHALRSEASDLRRIRPLRSSASAA
jgi:addiction module HigA family antidote